MGASAIVSVTGAVVICSRKRRFQTSNPAESRSRMAAAAAQGVALDQKDAGFRIGSGTSRGDGGRCSGGGCRGRRGAGDAASALIAAAMRSRRAGGRLHRLDHAGEAVDREPQLGHLRLALAHVARCARTVSASSASTAPRANAPSRSRVAACLATVKLGSTIELHRTCHPGAGSAKDLRAALTRDASGLSPSPGADRRAPRSRGG